MRISDDDYMIYDRTTNQWKLTEKALISRGIDLRRRLAGRKAMSPELLIDGLLTTVSEQIYGYIHAHAFDTARQDGILASNSEARSLLFRALLQQAVYVLNVGNLSYSIKPEERAAAINDIAKQILGQYIPSIGTTILYCGG